VADKIESNIYTVIFFELQRQLVPHADFSSIGCQLQNSH